MKEETIVKKVTSYILLIAMILSLPLNCYAMDEATTDDEIEYEGVVLLEKLLTKQFDSYKNGRLIDTDALFTPADSTELYKQYLLWYTGLTAATEEFWTNYEFDLIAWNNADRTRSGYDFLFTWKASLKNVIIFKAKP